MLFLEKNRTLFYYTTFFPPFFASLFLSTFHFHSHIALRRGGKIANIVAAACCPSAKRRTTASRNDFSSAIFDLGVPPLRWKINHLYQLVHTTHSYYTREREKKIHIHTFTASLGQDALFLLTALFKSKTHLI